MKRTKKKAGIGIASLAALLLSALLYVGSHGLAGIGNVGGRESDRVGAAKGLEVSYIDVAQGDSILLRCDGATMLIDCGGNDKGTVVLKHLEEKKVERLDVLMGTHPHEDHIGGMDQILDAMDVDRIFLPEVSSDTETFEDVLDSIARKGLKIDRAEPGVAFPLGGATVKLLGPNRLDYEEVNDCSIIVRVEYGSRSFLFTGDAGSEAEKDLMGSGQELKADVLKVGHHGSKYSTGKAFLEAVSPGFGVIMVGSENDYGHPAEKTMERLLEGHVEVLRTDQSGTITFHTDGSSLKYSEERSEN